MVAPLPHIGPSVCISPPSGMVYMMDTYMSLFRSSVGTVKVTSTAALASYLRPHPLCACSLHHFSKVPLCDNCSLCPALFRHMGTTIRSRQDMCRRRMRSHSKAIPMMFMAFTTYTSGRDPPSHAKTPCLGAITFKICNSMHARQTLNSKLGVHTMAFNMFAYSNVIKASMHGNPKNLAPKHLCRVARVYTVVTPNRPSSSRIGWTFHSLFIRFIPILVSSALSNPSFPPFPPSWPGRFFLRVPLAGGVRLEERRRQAVYAS